MNETSPVTAGSPSVDLPVQSTRELEPPANDCDSSERAGLLRPGASLKGYRLVSRLATGATTEVWLAMLTGAQGFEKGVALKAMLPDPARRPALVDLLTSEAAIGGRLYHPSIVQMLDFTQDEGRYFISMEYVDGLTLRQAERRLAALGRRFPLSLLVHVVAQICRGLHYAHELVDGRGALGFIHRNVTPENVILSRSGAVKLIDFGAARIRSISGPPGTTGVELAYAAPERVKNQAEDRRGDLYSLGVIMYELLCGRRPFAGEERELRSRIVDGRPLPARELVSDLPEGVVRVVQRAMSAAPDNRQASAEQLASDLQNAYDTHLLGLQGIERDPFDLRSILSQVFRDVPSLPGEAARLPFQIRNTPSGPTRLPTPVPIPISRDRSVRTTASDIATVTDDVTEPCVMTIEEAAPPQARVATPVSSPGTPVPPVSLPSLAWLFERREDERRAGGEIFQLREGSEAAPSGSVFDHGSRSWGEGARPATETGIEVPLPAGERAAPDVFAVRRGGEDRRSESAERRIADEPRPPRVLEAVRCFDWGLAFLSEKQYQLALDEWERALELDPNNRMYQTNLKRLRARL